MFLWAAACRSFGAEMLHNAFHSASERTPCDLPANGNITSGEETLNIVLELPSIPRITVYVLVSVLKNYVKPKWADCLLDQIKPLLVEDWLKKTLSCAEK